MLKPKEPTDTRPGTVQPDVIGQWGKMRLVRYEARGPRRHPVPVLIVPPLLAKPYVLDLAPGLSLVDHLVEQGLELFLLDFGIPDRRDRQLRFEDHLRVIDLAMNELLAQTGTKRATLLGYCLGGIFAILYAATHPDSVQNLVTLATPVDFSRAGPVYRYLRTLDVDGLVDRLGNVPGEWIRDQVWALTTMTMPARNAHTGDVLAPQSAEALLEVVSSADRDAVTVLGGTLGHVDIVVGPEGPAIMWPKLAAWLDARSGAGR
jgi:pimeloyl-ACP methyl ester carboxylesterase